MCRAPIDDESRISTTGTHAHHTAFDGTKGKLAFSFALVALEVPLARCWACFGLGRPLDAFTFGATLSRGASHARTRVFDAFAAPLVTGRTTRAATRTG